MGQGDQGHRGTGREEGITQLQLLVLLLPDSKDVDVIASPLWTLQTGRRLRREYDLIIKLPQV